MSNQITPTKAHIFNVLFLSYLIWITLQVSISMSLTFFEGYAAIRAIPAGGFIFVGLVLFLWAGYIGFFFIFKSNLERRFAFTAYWLAALTFPAIVVGDLSVGLSAQTMWLSFFTSVLIALVRNIFEGMGFLTLCLACSLVSLFYVDYVSFYSLFNVTPPMCPGAEMLPFLSEIKSGSAGIRCWEGPHFYRVSAVLIGPCVVGMTVIYSIRVLINSLEDSLVSERRERVKYKALSKKDFLTSLGTRFALEEEFPNFLQGSKNIEVSLIFMIHDLNNFKSFNAQHGYINGDNVLKEVAKILTSKISWQYAVYRLGGDEFASLHLVNKNSFAFKAYIESLCTSYLFELKDSKEGNPIYFDLSSGMTELYHDSKISEGIYQADQALRHAKLVPGGTLSSYEYLDENNKIVDQSKPQDQQFKMFISTSIKEGLLNNEFSFYGQPIFDVSDNTMIGIEALIRWTDASGALVPLDSFLDQFKSIEWEEPFFQILATKREDFFMKLFTKYKVPVFFNLDLSSMPKERAEELTNESAWERWKGSEGIIEISEKSLNANDIQEFKAFFFKFIKEHTNLKIALDDFGVVESNLDRLIDFDVDLVKLDRALITNVSISENKQILCRNLYKLITDLGRIPIAEGIESSEDEETLLSLGYKYQQGFYRAKPMPAQELLDKNYKPKPFLWSKDS